MGLGDVILIALIMAFILGWRYINYLRESLYIRFVRRIIW